MRILSSYKSGRIPLMNGPTSSNVFPMDSTRPNRPIGRVKPENKTDTVFDGGGYGLTREQRRTQREGPMAMRREEQLRKKTKKDRESA